MPEFKAFENEPPRDQDPAQHGKTAKERFGIPDPHEVMREVDRIVEARLDLGDDPDGDIEGYDGA